MTALHTEAGSLNWLYAKQTAPSYPPITMQLLVYNATTVGANHSTVSFLQQPGITDASTVQLRGVCGYSFFEVFVKKKVD